VAGSLGRQASIRHTAAVSHDRHLILRASLSANAERATRKQSGCACARRAAPVALPVRRRLEQSIQERRDRGSAADTETETSGAETSAAAFRRSRRCFVYTHGTIAVRGSHVTSAMTTESPLCLCRRWHQPRRDRAVSDDRCGAGSVDNEHNH